MDEPQFIWPFQLDNTKYKYQPLTTIPRLGPRVQSSTNFYSEGPFLATLD